MMRMISFQPQAILLRCMPPRRILAHYREEVKKQIQAMLEQDIIKEST